MLFIPLASKVYLSLCLDKVEVVDLNVEIQSFYSDCTIRMLKYYHQLIIFFASNV